MIERTADGRFRVRVLIKGTRKRKELGIFTTEGDASRVEKVHYTARRIEGGETVALFGDAVLSQREKAKSIRDVRNDWSRFKHHILTDEIALVPIRELRRRDIVEFVARLEAKRSLRTKLPLSFQTKQNTLNVLRVIVSAAINLEIMQTSPFVEITVAADRRTHGTWRYAKPPTQAGLLAAAKAHERRILAFAMYSGLRAGELATLRLEDVFAEGDDPCVVVRYGSPPAEPTKTGLVRTVPLLGQALVAVRAWLAGELAAFCPSNPHGLLFPLAGGTFRDPDHILPWARWREIRTDAMAQKGFRWHDLRHTCGTSLASGWWGRRWSTGEIQGVLGHADPKTTARYAKVADDAIASAARETRKAASGEESAPDVPEALPDAARAVAASIRKFAEIERSRLGDLNPRPAVYETAPLTWLRELTSETGTYGALLRSVDARDELGTAEALERYALGVLWRKEVRLALEVLSGGRFAVHRAVELQALLEETGVAVPHAEGSAAR